MQYQRIVFMQNDDATEPLEILDRDGEEAVIEYLAQWDYGEGEIFDEPSSGDSDSVTETDDGYRLIYNTRLGYIGLESIISE